MLWTVAAFFFTGRPAEDVWLDDFVAEPDYRFRKIGSPIEARRSWHNRAVRATPLAGWWRYWRQAGTALENGDGVVTLFPQLALMTAIRRCLSRTNVPIVAWYFNVGVFPTGLKARVSRLALRRLDRIVVPSTAEVKIVRDWLGLSEDVVQFVPLQSAPKPVLDKEDEQNPFIAAIGSANRDFPTLLKAAALTGLPMTVVAAPRLMRELEIPPNVTWLSGLSLEECRRIAQRARFSVVPLVQTEAASGQVTLTDAMRMGRPVIATRSAGTVDYIEDGRTGLLVPACDAEALAQAMLRLWKDGAERTRLAAAANAFADDKLSDEAAARSLVRILREANGRRLKLQS